jgi:hypothetical protein
MREFFGQHGKVVDSTVMVDRETGRSKGFGFITFEDTNVEPILGFGKLEIDGKLVSGISLTLCIYLIFLSRLMSSSLSRVERGRMRMFMVNLEVNRMTSPEALVAKPLPLRVLKTLWVQWRQVVHSTLRY